MNRILPFLFCALFLGACTSSEQSTSNQTASPDARDSLAAMQRSADLTSVEDTLHASVVTHSKPERSSMASLRGDANTAFTVQLGAFADPLNALTFLKAAKERFGDTPVFNLFAPSDRLYRVSVGTFDTYEEALEFRDSVLQLHPKLYTGCFINSIAR
jgi:cell division septation protein DedD